MKKYALPVLEILFLGPPEVRWDNHTISIQRKAPRALLFFLASRGTLVSRDEIISTFWGGIPEAKARLRFNENLSRLRKELPNPNLIIVEGKLVGLNQQKVFVDQKEFEDLIDKAGHIPWQIPENEPLPEHIFHLLEDAANLWRGPHFLPGSILPNILAIDDWHLNTANRLEHRRVSILQRLADHAYAIGDLETALHRVRIALENDSLNENLHYRLMLYLIDLGYLNEAWQHYNYVEALFRSELDISPPAKLISQYQRIRKLREKPTSLAQPKWELHFSMNLPFVGRKNTLEQIRRIFLQNKGVFILGEAGQGKTRLIQEFAAQMQPEHRVLVTTCRPLETALPFQPICEIFRRYVTPDEWLALPPVWASQLTRLLPNLKTMRPELEDSIVSQAPAHAQTALLEAIQQVFSLLSRHQPIFLVFDDTQWADEATLTTIAYLLLRPPFDHHEASLAVLAQREELSIPLENLCNSVQQSKHGSVVYLTQLKTDDLSNLAYTIFNDYPSVEFIENLENSTGGNPLYVLETLRSILNAGPNPDLTGSGTLPLAKSLQTLIETRLQRLPFSSRKILDIAAVVGVEFDIGVISTLAKQSEASVVQTIEDLEREFILQSMPPSHGQICYRFVHEKFREVLTQNLSRAKTQLYHRYIAEYLLKDYRPDQAGILAQHYGAAGELEKAFHYWVAAGEHARGLFSITDAARSFSQAKTLIKDIENALADSDIYQLFANWSEMAYEIQDSEMVRQLGNELLEHGNKRQSPLLIGTGLDALSDACMAGNQFDRGLELATQAIGYLEQSDNTFELMEAYIHCGVFHYMSNQMDEAIASFEDALALATADARPEVIRARANAHYQISLLRTLGGWPKRGYEHAQLSWKDANTSHRTYLKFSAYFVLAFSCYYMGRYQEANEHAHNGIDLAERTHGWRMLGYLHSYAAAIDLAMGKIDQAYQHTLETQRLGTEYQLNDVYALSCRLLGDVYLQLGAPEQAIPHYQSGVEAIGEHFIGGDNLVRMGFALFKSGQVDIGLHTMAFALAAFENTNVGLGILVTQIRQAIACAESQQWDRMLQLTNHIKEQSTLRSLPTFYLEAVYLQGKAILKDGHTSSAIDQFQIVIEEAKLLGNIWLELKALLSIKKAQRKLGENKDSYLMRIEAIKVFLRSNTTHQALQGFYQSFEDQIMGL